MKKYKKGQYEYANFHKREETIRTIVLFSISLALFLAGFITTKTKANLLTIVAVLGCLPASKSLVSTIMSYRVRTVSTELYNKLKVFSDDFFQLYNLYFTSYDKNFYIDHLILTSDSVIGFSSDKDFDEKKFITHLEKHLKLDGLNDINIKIFTKEDTYLRRLEELKKLDRNNPCDSLIELINNITL